MLDIKFIREHPEKIRENLKKRGMEFDLEYLIALDEKRRAKIKEVDDLRARQNILSEEIAKAKEDKRDEKIGESKEIKAKMGDSEFELKALEEEFIGLMCKLPNLLLESVPVGKDESDNKALRAWGAPPKFDFEPKDHVALGEELDLIDTQKAAAVAGTRFNYLKNEAALLEFALIQFGLSVLTSKDTLKKIAHDNQLEISTKPFVPIIPPVMIRPEVMTKMARLSEQDKEERYHLEKDDLYLVGSAEHTLGPLHMDETLPEEKFPIRYVGFSTSFRREAGSYGKDTRGILRVHQFDKLEMESFTLPEDSVREQDFIVAIQEYLLQQLEIPYRVVAICAGDMGAPDARQIDMECWMPGQNQYRETHTSDLMTDYQARRLNTKVRRKNGGTEFAHMNDATAFAVGRTLIAIMENYQEKDGSIRIPKVLQPFMGEMRIIKR